MQIKGSKVLVLGGFGLVGSAICRKLMVYSPAQIVVSSLKQSEAESAIDQLRAEFPNADPKMFVAKWGNIFTRTEWKDTNLGDVLSGSETRKGFIKDIFNELDEDMLKRSALYNMISEVKPDLVIDCINTATGIAYMDIYNVTSNAMKKIDAGEIDETVVENMMASSYIPQLIRHIQIMQRGLVDCETQMYFKVGTSGTGGMGFNIPYTHSEERPSRVLLSKTAVAGAQTLLLFLLARTPNGPIVKEIKPTATIAWKKIGYGDVKRRGQTIKLVDMDQANMKETKGSFVFDDKTGVKDTGELFRSVYIDTGENGIFSRGEFEAITALGQMEIVTPEEIAEYLVHEVRGGNTGHDLIQGLDAFTLGPTYRGGLLRAGALKKIDELEKLNNVDSVAFELLGPPRLSKLLYEAYMLRRICKSMPNAINANVEDLSKAAYELVLNDTQLRSQMLSIGLVILTPDGKNYFRGADVKIPARKSNDSYELTEENVNQWCFEGWVDLRPSSFIEWQGRLSKIMNHAMEVPADETGSRFTYTRDYWDNFENIDEGKIAGWVFEFEDKGWRFKR